MATITGTAGNDTLNATGDGDEISALAGNDTININGFDSLSVTPSTGSNSILFTTGGGGDFYYSEFSSPISLNMTDASMTVDKGTDGTDTLSGFSNGNESNMGFVLGGGDDSLTVDFDTGNINVFLQVTGGDGDDTITLTNGFVRAVYYDAPGSITYTGNNGDQISGTVTGDGIGTDTLVNVSQLLGSSFADMFNGGDGNEYFMTRGGDDTINGGGGEDTLRYDRTDMGSVTVNLANGTVTGTFRDVAFEQEVSNIEIIRGSNEDDNLVGSASDDELQGRNGDDFIRGGDGADLLIGNDGNDQIFAGADDTGNDTMWGGDGDDVVGGGAGDDDVQGDSGADTLFGGSGRDSLGGGDGDDVIWAGQDGDEVNGGNGNDTMGGGTGWEYLGGNAGNDVIYASFGNDFAEGGDGADEIFGGAGDDTLSGGAGNDTMYGGDGNDEFFITAGHGDDFIGGFASLGDNIFNMSTIAATSIGDLLISQSGVDVVIDTGEGTLTLWNADAGDITADDFNF